MLEQGLQDKAAPYCPSKVTSHQHGICFGPQKQPIPLLCVRKFVFNRLEERGRAQLALELLLHSEARLCCSKAGPCCGEARPELQGRKVLTRKVLTRTAASEQVTHQVLPAAGTAGGSHTPPAELRFLGS